MPLSFRTAWPYCIGAVVWGGWLTVMIHGLRVSAWYGYAFALIFLWAIATILGVVARARRRGRRELRRFLDGSGYPTGDA